MVSSVREKIWSVEKEKKRQRTLAREGALDAIRQRQEPKDNQPEYKEVDVREVPTETSNSDSVVESGEVKVKTSKPKKKSKKATKKT
jgi:hypothetical protein|tara:strand:+ start:569 stop:829 length:261 start_codon:yes stop_codon:yes gene_type:complete